MAKINKVYPPFFNGVSQQSPELVLDNQCKEMVNCIPDLVQGLQKRPPLKFVTRKDFATYPEMETAQVFHTYDRGEDNEEYIVMYTPDDATSPIQVYHKDGSQMTVEYNPDNETAVKNYLLNGNLKALTVQDRTWIYSRNAVTETDTSETYPLQPDYTRKAFYWIKRGSADRYNPFNYAVYLNNTTFAVDPDKPSSEVTDPPTGAEDSEVAAQLLANKINAATAQAYAGELSLSQSLAYKEFTIYLGPNKTGVGAPDFGANASLVDVSDWTYSPTTGMYGFFARVANYDPFGSTVVVEFSISEANAAGFTAEVRGSLLKITKDDGSDFNFSSWDSWGNQASEGWKGEVNKISDLPKDMPFTDVYVKIVGEENNNFTDYYVHWTGSSWEECLDPEANRGKLASMPIKMDRTALVNGVATFTLDLIDWSTPRTGNIDNNPEPSFLGRTIQDLFFYKNRLGVASEDSVILTESANYTNWFASTVVDIVDTDPVDITISTNKASKIYAAKPFNNSLYIFTKYAQYELIAEGAFGPSTVSLNNTTNYPMATDVEPVVVNDSLYFISTTDNRQQLREYIKSDNLSVKGIDLNVSTPTYLEQPIKKLIVDGVLGYIICATEEDIVYLYNYKEDGTKRIQSAWSKWEMLQGFVDNSSEYFQIGSSMLVVCKTDTDYRYHRMELDYNTPNDNVDTTWDTTEVVEYPYESKVVLPDYYPKMTDVRTPLNKILLKRIKIEGEGQFDADVYRKDYNTTFSKTHDKSMADLDFHVASKVGNVVITIKDSSINDFKITSVVLEGLLTTTSREMR